MLDLNQKCNKNSFPDTSVWAEVLANSDEYVDQYYSAEKFENMPVVGISWQQAKDFCKWRTEMYEKTQKKYLNPPPKKLEYRLPSPSEWELVANAGYSSKFQKDIDKNEYPLNKLHNIVVKGEVSDSDYKGNPEATITAPVKMYFPNKYGVFNLFGNVSEITNVEGLAKGGGWLTEAKDLKAEKNFDYKKANATLGFRCVCEVYW